MEFFTTPRVWGQIMVLANLTRHIRLRNPTKELSSWWIGLGDLEIFFYLILMAIEVMCFLYILWILLSISLLVCCLYLELLLLLHVCSDYSSNSVTYDCSTFQETPKDKKASLVIRGFVDKVLLYHPLVLVNC